MENMPMPKTRKPNAQWDANAAKFFNEICVEQVLANNRPQGCLNNKGYANLIIAARDDWWEEKIHVSNLVFDFVVFSNYVVV
jgi:hypothetical protein